VLISADERGEPVPMLATDVPTTTNGGISADGRTITYHLRKNVKWHDGKPFTSEDVAFTLHAIMNPANNVASRNGYREVDRVETPDPYTVRFHLRKKYAPFVSTVFGESDSVYCILPAHLLKKLPDINNVPFNSAPVGTGPFKVVSWQRGDHIEYARNDDYFLGKPGIEKVTVKFVPDTNTEYVQLRTHEVDWILEATNSSVPQLRELKDARLVQPHSNGFLSIAFNTQHPVVSDVRVRRGISAATDRVKINHDILHDSFPLAVADLPSFMWAFDASLKPPKYDLAQAKRLLTSAGITPQHRVRLAFATLAGNATDAGLVVQMQGALKPLGIDIDVHPAAGPLYFATAQNGGILYGGKFDMITSSWLSGTDPDDSSLYRCDQFPPKGNGFSRYCSAEMDAAQTLALSSYERSVRKPAYAKIEALLLRDVPNIFISSAGTNEAISSDFKNFAPNPVTPMANAYRWSI
jgi:peptide/nickel transport system substrate-binding protein